MDDASNVALTDRVMTCPAAQARFESVRAKLEGHRIRKVEFTNEVHAVGILLYLDNRHKVLVTMPELAIHQLLRDPAIAREEQDLYYSKYVYRPIRRRRHKPKTKGEVNE